MPKLTVVDEAVSRYRLLVEPVTPPTAKLPGIKLPAVTRKVEVRPAAPRMLLVALEAVKNELFRLSVTSP